VTELTLALGSWMLVLGGKAATREEGLEKCRSAVASGEAKRRFLENARLQGGDPDRLLAERGKRRSPHRAEFRASADGYVLGIDAFKTGLAGVHLGVGRNRTDEAVCAEAGMEIHRRRGDGVKKGDLVMEVWGRDEASLEPALGLLGEALSLGPEKPDPTPLVLGEITAV